MSLWYKRGAVIGLLLCFIASSFGVTMAQRTDFVAPILIVNTGNLNIRTGPGTNYDVLLVATGGTQFPVLGVARDLVWYQINTDAGIGWVNVEFTVARGDFRNVPFVDAPALVTAPVTTNTIVQNAPRLDVSANRVIVNTGNLNVRTGPGGSFSIITKVGGGVELGIVGRAPDDVWFLVEGTFGQGWINSQFVIFRGDFRTVPIIADAYRGGGVIRVAAPTPVPPTPAPTVDPATVSGDPAAQPTMDPAMMPMQPTAVPAAPLPVITTATNRVIVNTGNLNVRSGPGAGFSILAKVSGGVELGIVGRAPDDVWFLVEGTFGLGWVNSQFVIFRGDYRTVPILADAYRGGGVILPNTGTIGVMQPTAAPVVMTAIPAPVIATTTNRVIVNTGNLNVRSGPGGGFSVVAVVPGGTELAVVGRASDGVWHLVQGSFGQGWVNIEFVIFRGDYSTIPVIDVRG